MVGCMDALFIAIKENNKHDGKSVVIDQPASIEAIQKFADLSWKHHVSPTPAATKSFPNNNVMLQTGKVAMSMNGHWNI